MVKRPWADATRLDITMQRLCYQLIENHGIFQDCRFDRTSSREAFRRPPLESASGTHPEGRKIRLGELDVTFYRDDFRRDPCPQCKRIWIS